jgi:hypothetical protein
MQLQPISPATIWLLLKIALMVDPLNIEHKNFDVKLSSNSLLE